MKNAVRLLVSLVLSGVFLWLTFHSVDLAAVWAALGRVRPGPVCLSALALMSIQVARAARWGVLTRPFVRLPWRALWRISNLGNMLIVLLPLRLGELARPYLMRRDAGASFTSIMGAAAVERVIDGLLVTLLFFGTTAALRPPFEVPPALRAGALVALAIFGGALAVILTAWLTADRVPRLLRALARPVAPTLAEKLVGLLEAFLLGLRALPSWRAGLVVVLWTLAYWAANAMSLWWLMGAFGWDLPVLAGFTLVCVLVIGIMIPAGPGFLGPFQAAIVAGLAIFDVEPNGRLAYSMLAYALNLSVVVAFGLPYVFGRGAPGVGELVDGADGAAAAAPPP